MRFGLGRWWHIRYLEGVIRRCAVIEAKQEFAARGAWLTPSGRRSRLHLDACAGHIELCGAFQTITAVKPFLSLKSAALPDVPVVKPSRLLSVTGCPRVSCIILHTVIS